MSKELTPLEALKEIKKHSGKEIVKSVWSDNNGYSKTITIDDLCDIIKKYLNENWQLQDEVEALKEILKENEKQLKALEIIKEIIPIEEENFCYDKETGTYFFGGYEIPKEKYDLLKRCCYEKIRCL